MSTGEFFRQMFEEPSGRGSGKRLVGFLAMMVALFCIVWLVIHEGCTECVEGLLQVLIISACSLLGLTSITSIFKNGKVTTNKDINDGQH